jgi:hypothetical protein
MPLITFNSRKNLVKILILLLAPAALSGAEPVKFGRDVLPILSANCFACHGPDEKNRKAGLRLDVEANAKSARPNGAAIMPGDAAKSLMIQRLSSVDPAFVMPPPKAHKQVKPEQIEILRRWIVEGAKWGRHWSFEPVTRPAMSSVGKQSPINALVATALAGKGLSLGPTAPPQTLVRRLWLDLIGLPPTPEIADRFAADPSPAAYGRMVDDLLARPQFGEHWARMWLDLARYADTKGYEKDRGRTVWPYRDWVVNALNADMPLDQFTTEQLAGDLLPNPTQSQIIATAFHRNTMANDEGGTDDEEFRVVAVKDRIDTTMQVWMGLTMGCAKCHTHKYDPISHNEYYSFYALFNQTEDADRFDEAPTLEMISPEEQEERKRLQAQAESMSRKLATLEEIADREAQNEERHWRTAPAVEALSKDGATLNIQPDGGVTAGGKQPPDDVYTLSVSLPPGVHTALRLEALPEKTSSGELAVGRNGGASNFVLSEISVDLLENGGARPLKLVRPRADFENEQSPLSAALDGNDRTGWSVAPRTHERHTAMFDFDVPIRSEAGGKLRVRLSQQAGDAHTLRRVRLSTSELNPASLRPRVDSRELRDRRDRLAEAYQALKNFNENIVRLPYMKEHALEKQRTTKIQRRGNFLDPGDVVLPGTPAAFNPFPAGEPLNRLGVARWLVARDNPLTPRVWANRIWARLFGAGIVETEEDFGALGSAPANPDLLDWLAAEYRDNGWSMKKLIRTIVLSDVYRQVSELPQALASTDPQLLMFAHGARYRLGAEAIRDQALAVAGLLSAKMGGPPVMPPQPAGLWRSTYSGKTWIDAEGEDRYRRSLYTYLKRTTPYPSMMTFDGGSGEVCQIRRIRTNTPLQALVTLNDPVYLEAAAGLARRMVKDGATAEARAERGLRLALIRPLRKGEALPLVSLQRDAQKTFEAAPAKAEALLKSVRAETPAGVSPAAFAAWIVTANTILNLDEFLSRI